MVRSRPQVGQQPHRHRPHARQRAPPEGRRRPQGYPVAPAERQGLGRAAHGRPRAHDGRCVPLSLFGPRRDASDGSFLACSPHAAHRRLGHDLKLVLVRSLALDLPKLEFAPDSPSRSRSAIMYYIVSNPHAYKKLREELDSTFAPRGLSGVMEYDDVKSLPYLTACINEALRLHSTSGMGLPRIMQQEVRRLVSLERSDLLRALALTRSSPILADRGLRRGLPGRHRPLGPVLLDSPPQERLGRRRRRVQARALARVRGEVARAREGAQHLLVRPAVVRRPQRCHDGALLLHLDAQLPLRLCPRRAGEGHADRRGVPAQVRPLSLLSCSLARPPAGVADSDPPYRPTGVLMGLKKREPTYY